MSRNRHIKVIIAPDGTCAVDAVNFVGPSCKAATLEIADALSAQIGYQEEKPEARLRERLGQEDREVAR